MRTKVVWILIVLIGLGASSSSMAAPLPSPSATTYEVGTSGLCDFSSIADAIAAASPGDTIWVQDATFLEAPLTIAKDLTLQGGFPGNAPTSCLQPVMLGYTTVQRTGITDERILSIEAATVTVAGFVFSGNANGGGVAVSAGGTLDLEDTILRDNVADFGGGLHVVNATANLTGCSIRDNQANLSGGGMDVWGPDGPAAANLDDVVFSVNRAGNNGGALMLESDATVVTNGPMQFQVNQAANHGGAIYILDHGQLTINANPVDKVYIMDNDANGHGGGIFVSGGTVTLNGALDAGSGAEQIFLGTNTADVDGDHVGNGGGLCATADATVQASATAIVDSSAEYGGGIYLSSSTFTGDDVYINHNDAHANGGGIAAMSGSTVLLRNDSRVTDWNGTEPNRAVMGGGLYAIDGSDVTVDASTIGGNMASQHGGGVYLGGAATFAATGAASIERNYTYVGGIAGGGIYATDAGTRVRIDASQVATNTAIMRGGGLFVADGAAATLQNGASVWGNKTLDFVDGGAGVYVSGSDSTLTVDSSELRSNYAATDGGGLLNDRGTVTLNRAVLRKNYAHERGGGILNSGGTIQATDTYLVQNEAHNANGGGLYAEGTGSRLILERAWFVANLAPAANGGAIATYSTSLSAQRNYFFGNESDLEGSALYLTGAATPNEPTATIVNSFIVDNQTTVASITGSPGACITGSPGTGITGPPGTGSSLYVEGTKATVIHNTFARQVQESFAVYVGNDATVTLTNNIISNFVVGIRRLSTSTGTATASHTLYHSNFNNYDLGIVSTDDIPDGDPAFVGGYDYHLTGTSDAIDAGADAGVVIDWDGESRPWDGGFDIGADEFPDREFLFLPLITRGTP